MESVLAVLQLAMVHVPNIRGSSPTIKEGHLKAIGEHLTFDETFVPCSGTRGWEGLDPIAVVHRLIGAPELAVKSVGEVRFVWVKSAPKKGNSSVYGTCKAIGKRERELALLEDSNRHKWEITLSLDVWLLMTEAERERLVHHELMHCDYAVSAKGKESPSVREHDIEEFAATLARFGAVHEQIRPIALAMANSATAESVRAWVAGPSDAPLLGRWVEVPTQRSLGGEVTVTTRGGVTITQEAAEKGLRALRAMGL